MRPCKVLLSNGAECGFTTTKEYKGGWYCNGCGNLRSADEKGESPTQSEKVDHPTHYGGADNPFEPIKIIEHLGWGPGFCKGNALKYLMRAGKKSGESEADDLAKARWYIDRAIEGLGK